MSEQETITTICTNAVCEALKLLGLTSGELTQRKAEQTYGRWFRDEVKAGHIKPCRVGAKTRWYLVSDILTLRASQMQTAQIQLNR